MNDKNEFSLASMPKEESEGMLREWMRQQTSHSRFRPDLISESQLREQCQAFLSHLGAALGSSTSTDVADRAWAPVLEHLAQVSRERARQGFSPSETALFVLSLKRPLLDWVRRERHETDAWELNDLIDTLALHTIEVFQNSREEIITRQQQELLELSTPVVQLWEGVLALPLIGTLDSARTQVVMESLLERIVETGAPIAIIDITGVPMVDTLVAQHLLKTVAAARLMGADCIISGIRPQIAQTIVHLGVELNGVITKATIADAFAVALGRLGIAIDRPGRR